MTRVGTLDRREDRAQVGLRDHLDQLARHPRADRRALHPPPPLGELAVAHLTGRKHRQQRALAPVMLDRVEHLLVDLGVQRAPRLGGDRRQDERRHPVGVSRREQRREPEVARSPQRRALDAGGVEHGSEVVHLLLERRRARDGVREPRAAAVEQHEAREGRQPLEAPGGRGLLPDRARDGRPDR